MAFAGLKKQINKANQVNINFIIILSVIYVNKNYLVYYINIYYGYIDKK